MADYLTTSAWRLKTIKAVRKLSFRELELKTGIPRSALQRYTTGENKVIPPDRIKILADVLDVSPAWLAGWTKDAKK